MTSVEILTSIKLFLQQMTS